MNMKRTLASAVALAMVFGISTAHGETPEEPAEGFGSLAVVKFEKPLFLAGVDSGKLGPGFYDVGLVGEGTLVLTSEGGNVIEVESYAVPHEQELLVPAVFIREDDDGRADLVLLLPDGQGFVAGGSYSGVTERGTKSQVITRGLLPTRYFNCPSEIRVFVAEALGRIDARVALQSTASIRFHSPPWTRRRPTELTLPFARATVESSTTCGSTHRIDGRNGCLRCDYVKAGMNKILMPRPLRTRCTVSSRRFTCAPMY
jgi:hypothetical protein